ncbi:hypothetical protein BD311DRAFT_759969 [Dichomitus squalens]|uniref:Secreted protein n=1 Tax=Dichomitus squalens TaxID=114155 RepID=A0A4Q9MJ57_9APHY|nr:hypothetical protein BD311DRAFT_759969 [Dichomitus squalens]
MARLLAVRLLFHAARNVSCRHFLLCPLHLRLNSRLEPGLTRPCICLGKFSILSHTDCSWLSQWPLFPALFFFYLLILFAT